ncbi:MAG: hypothetical protein CVU38_02615 [Chloroflexi bacterium HGW-Chloroflexi-1]|nr:MAG: hypothetical protein CVU38_02615 [Chloroflexi bacterium HGW-Chloroflexi-1]
MADDQSIRCAECDTPFIWTAGEQAGEPRPDVCPACRLLAPAAGRARGLVKWFSRAKGYGFITPIDGPDLFVHKSGLAAGYPFPRAGQLVEFTLAHRQRGIDTVTR